MLTKKKGVDICVLDMPLLDTRIAKDLLGTFVSDLILQVLSFVAQQEREKTLRRQAEGIAAAKAKGVQFGRPPAPLPSNFYEVYRQWMEKAINLDQAAAECGMARSTFFYRARAYEPDVLPATI